MVSGSEVTRLTRAPRFSSARSATARWCTWRKAATRRPAERGLGGGEQPALRGHLGQRGEHDGDHAEQRRGPQADRRAPAGPGGARRPSGRAPAATARAPPPGRRPATDGQAARRAGRARRSSAGASLPRPRSVAARLPGVGAPGVARARVGRRRWVSRSRPTRSVSVGLGPARRTRDGRRAGRRAPEADQPAPLEVGHPVGQGDGRRPVATSTVVVSASRSARLPEDAALGGGVDRRGGVVEEQHPGPGGQGPGQGHALALARPSRVAPRSPTTVS